MAINITYPAPSNMAKVKKFGFYAPKTSNVDRVNGGRRTSTYTDPISISAGGTYTLDTFTWDTEIGGGVFVEFNDVYCLRGEMYLQILVDGSVVAEEPIPTSQSTVRVIADNNAVGNGSHTIEIRIENKGTSDDTLYVKSEGSLLEIIYGLVIKETTETTLKTIDLPDYTLIDEGGGDFKYDVGVIVLVYAIRRTSSEAHINMEHYRVYDSSNNYITDDVIPAGNDTDPINIGGYYLYSDPLDIKGYVGNEGDVVIITNLYYNLSLAPTRGTTHAGRRNFVSTAKGVHFITIGSVALKSDYSLVNDVLLDDPRLDDERVVYSSDSGNEIINTGIIVVNMSQLIVENSLSTYTCKGAIYFLEVIVIE